MDRQEVRAGGVRALRARECADRVHPDAHDPQTAGHVHRPERAGLQRDRAHWRAQGAGGVLRRPGLPASAADPAGAACVPDAGWPSVRHPHPLRPRPGQPQPRGGAVAADAQEHPRTPGDRCAGDAGRPAGRHAGGQGRRPDELDRAADDTVWAGRSRAALADHVRRPHLRSSRRRHPQRRQPAGHGPAPGRRRTGGAVMGLGRTPRRDAAGEPPVARRSAGPRSVHAEGRRGRQQARQRQAGVLVRPLGRGVRVRHHRGGEQPQPVRRREGGVVRRA